MNQKLKQFRREVGINQYELADAASIPRYKIQLAEQGIAILTKTEAERVLSKLGLSVKQIPDWMILLIDEGGSDV